LLLSLPIGGFVPRQPVLPDFLVPTIQLNSHMLRPTDIAS
jgi:hypothetical protein